MHIICEGLDLSEAVLTVSKAISTRTTNPILEGIKFVAEEDTLTLSATDMEISIEKKIKAEVITEGEVVVPGKFFSEFIKKLTNEKLELTLLENNQLKIKYTDSESSLQCYSPDEYPVFKKVNTEEYFALKKKSFKNLVNKCIFAVAVDDSRPILKGVLLEVSEYLVTAVALDGYRLALVREDVSASNITKKVIVPAKSLNEIAKLLEDSDEIINIYIQNNFFMVDLGDTIVLTRLLEGEFLNYNQIISSTFDTEIEVNKSTLENSIERASLLSKIGQNNLVQFDIKENNMVLQSNSELGNIKENIQIVFRGKELNIAFNARYFTECFRVTTDSFVRLSFNSARTPCIIKPMEGDEYLYLILPVRVL